MQKAIFSMDDLNKLRKRVNNETNNKINNNNETNKNLEIPVAVLDIETTPFKYQRYPQPFCVGYYDGSDYIYFWNENYNELIIEVVEFIRKKRVIIYAHNGGKFDWHYFFDHFNVDKKSGSKKFQIINGRIGKAYIGKSELRDSYMILPVGLSQHGKDEIRYSLMEPDIRNEPENKQEILIYLKKDCVSLYEWLQKFINRFGLKYTIAGAAFDEIYKTGYNTNIRTDNKYDEIFREYYYGGRVQAFKTGVFEGHYLYVDINSAYSFAMKHDHPYNDEYRTINNPNVLPSIGKYPMYFAKIRAISKGCLPYIDKKIHKTEYYNDNEIREYFATSWEIEIGIKTNTLKIIEIIEIQVHTYHKNFGEFVDKFYNEKKIAKENKKKYKDQNNEAEQLAKDTYIFAKTIQNASYGKFGQNPALFKKYELLRVGKIPRDGYPLDMEFGWSQEAEYPTGIVLWSRPDPGESYYNVAVAASITGFVRSYVWEHVCGSEGVLYTDTDSMICKNFGGKIGTDIGEWELEGETYDAVYIGGRKLYSFPVTEGRKNGMYCYKKIKKAHKGARLCHTEIMEIVREGKIIEWKNPVPTYSVKKRLTGKEAEFLTRRIRSIK